MDLPVWLIGRVARSIELALWGVGIAFVLHLVLFGLLWLLVWVLPGADQLMLSVLDGLGLQPVLMDVFLVCSVTAIALTIGGWVLWRWVWQPDDGADDSHGSARWAEREDLVSAGLLSGEGLLLGKIGGAPGSLIAEVSGIGSGAERLRYSGPAHLLTIAPTRAGKGVGAIIPNLLSYTGSVLCIDPKGENARITAAVRQHELGQAVYVLDPYGIAVDASGTGGGGIAAAYNPLDGIDPFSIDAVDDARLIADTLVHDRSSQTGEAHWNEEAKSLIAGLVLHQLTLGRATERTLGAVRDALVLAPTAWQEHLAMMAANPGVDGIIAATAHRMQGKSEKEFSSVLSTAQRHTHFLDGPRMRRVTGSSDFALGDLKAGSSSPKGGSHPRRPVTIYLVLPPERLATHGRWLRLMVAQALQSLARASANQPEGQGTQPVLFLLDEFAALGRLEAVETAFGLMAGYGVQLWPFLQDLSQLRALYGEGAGTFLANAAVLQAFGTNDHATAKLLSDMLGQSTVMQESRSSGQGRSQQGWFGETTHSQQSGISTGPTGRPLLMPDEIRRISADEQLLFVQGQPPVLAGKLRYFEEGDMAALVAHYGPTSTSVNTSIAGEIS